MPSAAFLDLVHAGSLSTDPFYLTLSNNLFDAATWPGALPAGSSASVITLSDTYHYSDAYGPHSTRVDLVIRGDFSDNGGGWQGTVSRIVFKADGAFMGSLGRFGGGLDLADIVGEHNSGVIWKTIALDGFRGDLTEGGDYLYGSDGRDRVNLLGGHDYFNGGDGNDRIDGGRGDDTIYGGNDRDVIRGGAGRDDLRGGDGSDVLRGGGGKDTLFDDSDDTETWYGGKGGDRFQMADIYHAGGTGVTVKDFSRAEHDKVDLSLDPAFIFFSYDNFVYLGAGDFTAVAGQYEIRMENGLVEVDNNGDGAADMSMMLEGETTLSGTRWLLLADGFEFG